MTIEQNLRDDLTDIGTCRVVFMGHLNPTSGYNAVWFNSGDWDAVKTYIEGGGRLMIFAETEATMNDETTLNDFLDHIESSIDYIGGSHAPSPCNGLTPGTANIAQGLSVPFEVAGTAELSGGTNVFETAGGVECFQVEQLGDGFVFVFGDSNAIGICNFNAWCEFISRLWTYDDGDII